MADGQNEVKLQLGSRDACVSADGYVDFLQNAIATLKAIDKGLSTHGTETLEWLIVDVGSNSPLFAVVRSASLDRKDNGRGQGVIDSFMAGVESLNNQRVCPPGFTEDALLHVKQMAATAIRHHLHPIVSAGRRQIVFGEGLPSNANWAFRTLALQKRYYSEYGSLEGTLKALNATRKGDRLVIVERLTGDETTCILKRKELDAKVREAWKNRVAVTGTIRFDRSTRRPVRVIVEDIRILRDRSQLPQIDDLRGADITGGIESSEYIRGLRSDD